MQYYVYIFFIYRFDKTLSGSSKISSKSLVDLLLTLVDLGFDAAAEDFIGAADVSLKISSIEIHKNNNDYKKRKRNTFFTCRFF
jgi:hypothetical protein